MNPADEDMTVPTYEREETPVITPRPGPRFSLQRAPVATAPIGATPRPGRLGIGASSNARAARLGINSGLASRAARLGLTPVVDPGDEEKLA